MEPKVKESSNGSLCKMTKVTKGRTSAQSCPSWDFFVRKPCSVTRHKPDILTSSISIILVACTCMNWRCDTLDRLLHARGPPLPPADESKRNVFRSSGGKRDGKQSATMSLSKSPFGSHEADWLGGVHCTFRLENKRGGQDRYHLRTATQTPARQECELQP